MLQNKLYFVMLIYSIHSVLFTRSVAAMLERSDSQNRFEEQLNLSEGTSPSSSYDDGSRSTPSNLIKATTMQRKKRTSESEEEDSVVAEEVTSNKKVMRKEYGAAATTKLGLKQKAPAKRAPMSKVRQCTVAQEQAQPSSGVGKERKEMKRGR